MLKHCVFLNFNPEVTEQQKELWMKSLAELGQKIDGMMSINYGENLDFEAKTPEYDYGFIITFKDKQANDAYANNEEHQAIGAQLVAACNGGYDGIIVFDLLV